MITITGYTAARNRMEELEAEYLAAHPGDTAAGYWMNPMDIMNMLDGEWELRFSPTKYAEIINARARRELLKQAGQSHDNERFGPYRGSRSDEAVGA